MSDKLMCTEGTTKLLGLFQILDELDEGLTGKAEEGITKNTDSFSHEEKEKKGASGENTIVEKESDIKKDTGVESTNVENEKKINEGPRNETERDNFQESKTTSEKQSSEEKISCEVEIEKKNVGEESTIIEKESETENARKSENEFYNLTQQNHQEEKVICKNKNECEASPEETINCEDETWKEDTSEENTIVEKKSGIEKELKSETEHSNFMQQNPQEAVSCEDKMEKKDIDEENTHVEKEVKETPKSETEHNKLIEENPQKKETITCEKQSPKENIDCEENNEIVIDNEEDTDLKCPKEANINKPFVEEVKEDDPTHQEDEKSVKSCHTEEGKEDSVSVSHEDEVSVKSCQDDLTIDLHEESDVAISENVDDCDEDQEEPKNCHPYSFVIDNFELIKEQKMQTKIGPPKSLKETPVRMINSRIGLLKLLPALNSAKEIALKLTIDSKNFETTIQLLAISTRDTDYIIDVGKLNKELLLLTEIFINPKIVKIIYGSERVLTALQNILHLYLVNIFDCERAGKVLQTGFKSIDMILRKEYSYKFANGMRQVDCRLRPLSSLFQDYCRAVSHYLIYIYHDYKNKLLSKDEKLYKELLDEFRETSKIVYPHGRSGQLLSLEEKLQNRHKCQLEVLEKLNEWRNDTAIKLNENPITVVPKAQMITLSSTLPATEFSVCCISNSSFVKSDVEKILVIIREAKRKYHLEELPIISKKKTQNLRDSLWKELDICTSSLNGYQNMNNKMEKPNLQKIANNAAARKRSRPGPRRRLRQRFTTLPQKSEQNTNFETVNSDYSPGFNYFKQATPVHYSSQKASSSKDSSKKWNNYGAAGSRSSYNELKIQKGRNAFKRKFSSIQTDEGNYSRKKRN